jgi:hypothetical protein
MKNKHPETVEITVQQLLDLIHWSRRYADYRTTYVPSDFNRMYDAIMAEHPFLAELEKDDETLMERGKYFPYAQDGNYNSDTGVFDARPRHINRKL